MESVYRIYRPRDPRKPALCGPLHTLCERVKGSWEERFERTYGFWRGLADMAVARYLDCGDEESRARDASLEVAVRDLRVGVQQNSVDIRELAAKVDTLTRLEERVAELERRSA